MNWKFHSINIFIRVGNQLNCIFLFICITDASNCHTRGKKHKQPALQFEYIIQLWFFFFFLKHSIFRFCKWYRHFQCGAFILSLSLSIDFQFSRSCVLYSGLRNLNILQVLKNWKLIRLPHFPLTRMQIFIWNIIRWFKMLKNLKCIWIHNVKEFEVWKIAAIVHQIWMVQDTKSNNNNHRKTGKKS